ncbi:U3 small nucleolar RNA-associated protein 14 homolog A [Strigops habroptila]|uniref:U3 small nucleolar RNA-associated protein 14 homolog A n=1 Tax=Strigops habroptila TaxID=2489341 RepID=UPI0011CF66F9|nr:U3 small nucleolar RNA-associated protein 14 homolog A [Strigops habroptila]
MGTGPARPGAEPGTGPHRENRGACPGPAATATVTSRGEQYDAARRFVARSACGAMAEEWLGTEVAAGSESGDGEEEEEEEEEDEPGPGPVTAPALRQGQEEGERRHRRLLEAISSLSGRKRRRLAERTEASAQVSEFNVSTKGAGEKLVLSELLQPIRPKSALSGVKKELTRVKQKAAVELPLSKEEAKRVVREAAYVTTSKDVGKWQQVVLQNRRAEQLVFPLKQDIATVVPLEQAVSAWKARTPLEQEIFGLLHKTKQPITDPLLMPEEAASLQAMSLEEARQRRAELQKARVVQSYYEAKARREKKIKSKKYHRMLKKSRRRKALKEFELLQKSDPEAALARLEELEQLRMQERMSLKHQNKGKWACSRAIIAKYDLEARKAMQEQLAKNKELMQKVRVELPEEKPDDVPEEDLMSVTIPTIPMGTSRANPWLLGKPSSPAKEPEAQEGQGDVLEPGAAESKEEMEEEEEEEMSEEEALLQDFAQKRHVRQQRAGSPEGPGADATEAVSEPLGDIPVPPVCAEAEASTGIEPSAGIEPPAGAQEGVLLWQQLGRARTMEDVEALASEEHVEEPVATGAETGARQPVATGAETGARQPVATGAEAGAQQPVAAEAETGARRQQEEGRAGARPAKKAAAQKKQLISLQAVLEGRAQEAQCPSLPVLLEEEEGGIDQRGVITEAFAGDDVVADFRREKHKAEQDAKPQPVNLVLPGWGEWGGSGLKPSTRKIKRFLLKPSPAPPRKDQHLPHVIMSEKRNIYAAAHQVSELPFPFERHQQFEQSIRAPVGATWNTQRAFQKLTAPRVITRSGHIIQPISAEDIPTAARPALEPVPGQGAQRGWRRGRMGL